MPREALYYIMSPYAPCGNSASWWAVDGNGYVCDLDKAWQVSRQQADGILSDRRGDRAFLVSEIDAHTQRHFDVQGIRAHGIRSLSEVSNA
jgi:hypothetical protein